MADFASTNDNGVPIWINLDYVFKINRGLDPQEGTEVFFINGERLHLSRSDGGKLVAQLNQCCTPRRNSNKPGQRTEPTRKQNPAGRQRKS